MEHLLRLNQNYYFDRELLQILALQYGHLDGVVLRLRLSHCLIQPHRVLIYLVYF